MTLHVSCQYQAASRILDMSRSVSKKNKAGMKNAKTRGGFRGHQAIRHRHRSVTGLRVKLKLAAWLARGCWHIALCARRQ